MSNQESSGPIIPIYQNYQKVAALMAGRSFPEAIDGRVPPGTPPNLPNEAQTPHPTDRMRCPRNRFQHSRRLKQLGGGIPKRHGRRSRFPGACAGVPEKGVGGDTLHTQSKCRRITNRRLKGR